MKAADLFCGAGGAARGMHAAGFDVPHGIDHDGAALRSYNESLPGDPIQHDLRLVRPSVLPPLRFDLIHGSPPCQGFSQAKGHRDEGDHRNQLVWRFVDWVGALQPRAVTMENVPGMATISSTFMDRVIGAFREVGYAAKWRELNAADYGVPQTRRRIFVVGVRDDLEKPSRWFPRPTHAKGGTATLDGRRLPPWRTVSEAIGDLFLLADGGVMTGQYNEKHQFEGRRPMHPVDEAGCTIRAGTPPLVIPNHEATDHDEEVVERLEQAEIGEAPHPAYARADPDGPAFTLVAGNCAQPIVGPEVVPKHEPVEPSEGAKEKMASYAPGTTHNSVTERRLNGDDPAFTVAANHTSMIVGQDVAEKPANTILGGAPSAEADTSTPSRTTPSAALPSARPPASSRSPTPTCSSGPRRSSFGRSGTPCHRS